jgi:heterodisulfide reductase subunit B
MKYLFYPGCTLKTTSREYGDSAQAVMRELGVELAELPDWNCCGATAASGVNYLLSLALPARNLALAEQAESDLVAACSGCFVNLVRAKRHTQQSPATREKVNIILAEAGLQYHGTTRVRHLLDVVVNDVGLEAVSQRVRQSLEGLRVAPYYGCQIVRPYAEFDDPANPVSMDRLITALGAEAVPYPLKTACCGGVLATTKRDIALKLIGDLMAAARDADCIITVCPLCQLNLDAWQAEAGRRLRVEFSIPVLFFTQLMGLAFGLPESELGLSRHVVSASSLMKKLAPVPTVATAAG